MADDDTLDGPSGAVFWITAAIGAAIVVFGIRGLFENEPRGATSAIRWFVGGALAVDLIVVPLGAVTGWGLKKVLPAWSWPVVRTALFTSVLLIVFAAPLVLEEGGQPSNVTVRPRDYGSGLVAALVVTWAVAGVWLLARRRSTE